MGQPTELVRGPPGDGGGHPGRDRTSPLSPLVGWLQTGCGWSTICTFYIRKFSPPWCRISLGASGVFMVRFMQSCIGGTNLTPKAGLQKFHISRSTFRNECLCLLWNHHHTDYPNWCVLLFGTLSFHFHISCPLSSCSEAWNGVDFISPTLCRAWQSKLQTINAFICIEHTCLHAWFDRLVEPYFSSCKGQERWLLRATILDPIGREIHNPVPEISLNPEASPWVMAAYKLHETKYRWIKYRCILLGARTTVNYVGAWQFEVY